MEACARLTDAGIRLISGSPRRQAALLAEQLDHDAGAALSQLAVAVERARYDRQPMAARELDEPLATLTAGLAGRRRRLLAAWWPLSLRPSRLRSRRS